MRNKRENRENAADKAAKQDEYRNVYLSLRREAYEAVSAAAKHNHRSVGGELLFAWESMQAANAIRERLAQ
jgi:hypothetical protein